MFGADNADMRTEKFSLMLIGGWAECAKSGARTPICMSGNLIEYLLPTPSLGRRGSQAANQGASLGAHKRCLLKSVRGAGGHRADKVCPHCQVHGEDHQANREEPEVRGQVSHWVRHWVPLKEVCGAEAEKSTFHSQIDFGTVISDTLIFKQDQNYILLIILKKFQKQV